VGVAITAYTGTDAIRGVIGVTDNEVTDAMLIDQRLDLELTVDLNRWAPTHAAAFATGSASGATADEQLIANYISLYAQYFCVLQVMAFMKLAMPQLIGDGKAEMRRFQMLDLEAIEKTALARVTHYRNLLSEALGDDALTPVSYVGSAVPTYDPVAGP